MSDLPIIMSAPMVRAAICEAQEPGCIDGKTMTRRLAYRDAQKGEPTCEGSLLTYSLPDGGGVGTVIAHRRPSNWQKVKAGDRLWVRENAYFTIDQGTGKPAKTEGFFADGPNPFEDNCTVESRPSIHMPRWASRLTLIVTTVKIERLQDITEADARAEGCGLYVPGHGWITRDELRADPGYSNFLCARLGFQDVWQTLHGADSWNENPHVVAISFRPVLANIDSLKEQAA